MTHKKPSKVARILSLLTARPESMRQRWRREGMLTLVLLLLIVAGYQWFRFHDVRKNSSQAQIRQMLEQTERILHILVTELIQRHLVVIRRSGEKGGIQFTDLESLNRQFLPMLRRIPLRSSLALANSAGTEYLLHDDGISWQTRFFAIGEAAIRTEWEGITTSTETWTERIEYDPRSPRLIG